MEQTTDEVIPLAQLAKIYRKIKLRMEELTKEYDTQTELLKEELEAVKFEIKDQMKAQGATSIKTEFGTISLVTKTRYTRRTGTHSSDLSWSMMSWTCLRSVSHRLIWLNF